MRLIFTYEIRLKLQNIFIQILFLPFSKDQTIFFHFHQNQLELMDQWLMPFIMMQASLNSMLLKRY